MGVASLLLLGLRHPYEFRALVQYKLWHDPLHRIEDDPETSGWNQERMRKCWTFLDLTSRSFAAVIKELEGELSRVICIFYLVLRALDTVEDDMTLDLKLKTETLRIMHDCLDRPGWCFTQSGPNEKDRIVLVDFDAISGEYRDLDVKYRNVIKETCFQMGNGMAYYAEEAEKPGALFAVDTLSDYDLYCHYVAGIIGEGLSKLFSASGKEMADLGSRLSLSNAMGLHLQKTNVTRDFREDLDDGRLFWPKAIWSKYASHPSELTQPGNETRARHCLVEMCFDAMQHSIDALDYLSLLKNQSVFNFCAIPQVMAIATLDECFGNLAVYRRNVKIRKGVAVDLIMRATNPREVAQIFRFHARRIHAKARPSDPNFLRICILVGRIEQWTEARYPSWVFDLTKKGLPPTREDAKAMGIRDNRARQLPLRSEHVARGVPVPRANDDKMEGADFMIIIIITIAVLVVLAICIGLSYLMALWISGGDISTLFDRFEQRHAVIRPPRKEL